MQHSATYQLDLIYKGRDVSIMTAPSGGGWVWSAVLDNRLTIEDESILLPSPEMALANGKAAVEDYIDSGDDC